MDKAKTLYENSVSWKNESLKEFLMKDMENTLDKFNIIRREDQCKESVIGSQGGRVVDNHCQLLIPEGGLDHEVSFQLNVNAKKTNLPNDVLPISPVMECIPKMELYEAAKVTLPRWCETDDPNVQVIILSHAKEGDQWKPIHEECLSNAKQDIRFSTKWVNKFVATVKKCLIHHTIYKLHSDVWFSPEGNFVGVLYVKDKSVEEIWRKKLETKRYEPSRLVTNPISVKGRDLI
uniref:uncharacterized protein LOC120344482 n=1 Tax=Styela clava TaxID=7725 RepID=UPI00193A3C07|nr:uncharacterized protein LOC120344482 [Styela clava]